MVLHADVLVLLVVLQLLVQLGHCETSSNRSFLIDYENDRFLRDGQPFRYISGSMHYFRVPKVLWRDRLEKFKAAGLNTVQTYIEWSLHEPEIGQFENLNDITDFISLAQKVGLLVILRPGPYIDAERDMGGLPNWLIREDPNVQLRTSDPSFTSPVERWFSLVLPRVRTLLYSNGGPVIMVQVENEYGDFVGCDLKYLSWLRDTIRRYLVDNVLLFTTDNGAERAFECGQMDDVYKTVDFGTNDDPVEAFAVQRRHQPRGPLVNSEFYAGWLDFWGQPQNKVSSGAVAATLEKMLSINASVNFYMFHGGTSFGFKSGAYHGTAFEPCVTSYDYDAPLDEAGDPTEKYYAIRTVLEKFADLSDVPLLTVKEKMDIGPIQMYAASSFPRQEKPFNDIVADYPLTFEQLGFSGAYVVYSTIIAEHIPGVTTLSAPGLRDRAVVTVDFVRVGILSRMDNVTSINVPLSKGSSLALLVENQGRICTGPLINEQKGIVGNVTLNGTILTRWSHHLLPLSNSSGHESLMSFITDEPAPISEDCQSMYYGKFSLPSNLTEPLDTFLRLDGWGKGVASLNGFNLGRYWPSRGPQVTLYAPAHLFKTDQDNVVLLFEAESCPCQETAPCTVSFVREHVLNGTVYG